MAENVSQGRLYEGRVRVAEAGKGPQHVTNILGGVGLHVSLGLHSCSFQEAASRRHHQTCISPDLRIKTGKHTEPYLHKGAKLHISLHTKAENGKDLSWSTTANKEGSGIAIVQQPKP